jgi:hypothetical protein
MIVLFENTAIHYEVKGHCMCKEMLVIPVDTVMDKKRRIIRKNGGPRRRRGKRGCRPPPTVAGKRTEWLLGERPML